ncbi:MAG: hypothetical protein DHS20C18_02890 [Saprospiraceae bacterium]|nr:MAG: hypothetical protein DHS20C18_02890 [Saprospiraceae bacterium]
MSDSRSTFPILGTAMWGWTVEKKICFDLLDTFYGRGFREVDAATNYPINRQPEDFRLSEKILQEWIAANGVKDLKIIMKVGSINNMRGPENNLSKSFLLMVLDEYQYLFSKNLSTLMIHWDNRQQVDEIRSSLEALKIAREAGLKVGLSGIKYPEVYATLNREFQFSFCIQIKHNLLHSDYARYAAFHKNADFLSYGINAGGLKLDPEAYHELSSLKARGGNIGEEHPIVEALNGALQKANQQLHIPRLSTFNHCGLIYAACHPDIQGILIGTSKVEQLKDTLSFMELIRQHDYSSFYQNLQQIAQLHATG